MRGIGLCLTALVLLTMPFASACYRPRVASCRGPVGDFSGITDVRIGTAFLPFGFEGGSASAEATLDASTMLPDGNACVAIHAELRDSAGGLVDTLDTPIQATVTGGFLQTSSMIFYHSSSLPMRVVVTALGTTVRADVTGRFGPDAFFPGVDAVVLRDAGHDSGRAPIDAGTDVSIDASDSATDDAATDDADIDAGP